MNKYIVGLFIILLMMTIAGVVMGFVYLFNIAPLWLSIVSLIIFMSTLIALIVLLYEFVCKIVFDIRKKIKETKDAIKKAIEALKSLTPREILAIILKLLKKYR